MSKTFTHNELQDIACSWLKRSRRAHGPGCHIALKEVGAIFNGERADAWGYRWGGTANGIEHGSVLIEIKTSRSDFFADENKPHRAGFTVGMGRYRYYMCPEGLITLNDVPHGWGLLWVNQKGSVLIQAGHVCCITNKIDYALATLWAHKCNHDVECDVLAHLLTRVGDPEEVNRRIRNAENKANRLARYHDDYHSIRKEKQLIELQYHQLQEQLKLMGKMEEQNLPGAIKKQVNNFV